MSLESLDKNIKSSIYSYESDVPVGIWDTIDKELRPKKNRWLLWVFTSIAILGISILLRFKFDTGLSPMPAIQLVDAPINVDEAVGLLSTTETDVANTSTQISIPDQPPIANKPESPQPATKSALVPIQKTEESLKGPTKQFQHGFLIKNQGEVSVQTNATANSQSKSLAADAAQVRTSAQITPLEIRLLEVLGMDPKIDVCPTFSSSMGITPFFELSLLGGLPDRTFALRDQELQAYQDLRENTEKIRSSVTLQALVGLDIGDRLEVKSGLGLTRVYEVFDYIDQSSTRTITNIITDTILVNGVPEIRSDTNIVTEYGQRIKLSQNRYTYLDLPILAAYKFKVGQHTFFIQGGASFNLLLHSKGDILTPDEQIISIDSKDRDLYPVYKNRAGIDLLGSVGYEYELMEKNVLRLMLSLRHSLSDMTIEAYPLGQRYDHFQLGISWKHQF